jgi:hypothetical protein
VNLLIGRPWLEPADATPKSAYRRADLEGGPFREFVHGERLPGGAAILEIPIHLQTHRSLSDPEPRGGCGRSPPPLARRSDRADGPGLVKLAS